MKDRDLQFQAIGREVSAVSKATSDKDRIGIYDLRLMHLSLHHDGHAESLNNQKVNIQEQEFDATKQGHSPQKGA